MARTFRFAALLLVLVGAAIGCTHAGDGRAEPRDFAGEESKDVLVEQFLDALARNDAKRLAELSLTFEEFETIVWPELDASRPETNLDATFVWTQYQMRSRVYFDRLLDRFGGCSYELVSIELQGEPKSYETFMFHDDPILNLIAEDGSREERLLFGAIIEYDNRFKIYGYSTD